MTEILSDVRYALRSLRKAPIFTVVAVLSLALGIGANTAIFSLLNQVILRLLPVKDPQQLAMLSTVGHHYGNNNGANAISHPMFRDFAANNQVFSGMFCRYPYQVSVGYSGQTELAAAEFVSGSYFSVLGVGAFLGRTLTDEDDQKQGGPPLAVLSYDYWETHLGGDRNILGKIIVVNAMNLSVAGVTQAGFDGMELGRTARLFIPIMMEPLLRPGPKDLLTDRRSRWVNAYGRLKPGISRATAKASLQPFMHSMLEMEVQQPAFSHVSPSDREEFLKSTIDLLPGSQGRSFMRQQLAAPLWALMAITGLALLIACANVANLLLARGAGRRKEIAVRMAMGAGRARLVRQLMIESLVLSGIGGAMGIMVAFIADRLLLNILLASRPDFRITAMPDVQVLLFTLGITALTGLIFGLVPALQATRPDIAPTLKDQASAVVSGGSVKLRKALVAAQVTLSLLLLIGAGLFVRSLRNLRDLGPGFPVDRLVVFEVNPLLNGYDLARSNSFYRQLTELLKSTRGIESVGLANVRILQDNEWDSTMTVEGYTPVRISDRAQPFMNAISPNYFATMGIPIVAGRDFTMQDSRTVEFLAGPGNVMHVPAVAIVNEKFASRFFKNGGALGRHIGFGGDPGSKTNIEIIGIVKNVKYTNIREDIPPQAFLPYATMGFPGSMSVYIRTSLDEGHTYSVIRSKVRDLDANVPIYDLRSESAQLDDSLRNERLIASLSTVFGFLAVLLTTVGLYGVLAYAVARRTREIGIRMALGAIQGDVLWMVMREVLALVGLGLAIGLPASFLLTRYVQSQLFGVQPNDPATFVLAVTGLSMIASLAGYIPALRASRIDPIRALRYE